MFSSRFIARRAVLSGLFICLLSAPSELFAQESEPADSAWDSFGWIAYPYIFYSPETNLAFGLGGILYFRFSPDTSVKPSSITPSVYYTINDQYDVTIIPEFYIGKEYFIYSYFSFGKYVDRYYGIGYETPDIEEPEYEHQSFTFQLNLQPQFSETFRAGLYSRLFHRTILDTKLNPYLPDPDLPGSSGGTSFGLGGVFAWDTRDHRFYPTGGVLNEFRAVYYSRAWGSDFDYNKYEVDLRGYRNVGGETEHVLGLQLYSVVTTSATPFYDMALLGSKTIMRGYYMGRFRDKSYLAGQAEYRTHLFWRIGMVAFAGAGQVVPELRELALRQLQPNYGFGFRLRFDESEKLDIRFDIGFGKETSGVYFDIQQAF